MSSRYDDKIPRINNSENYQQVFEDRNVKFIKQYNTPELTHAHYQQIADLEHHYHSWKLGDKFYKLASKHYNNASLWWVIAWYNKAPTESHVKPGQIINIPLPLSKIMSILRIK